MSYVNTHIKKNYTEIIASPKYNHCRQQLVNKNIMQITIEKIWFEWLIKHAEKLDFARSSGENFDKELNILLGYIDSAKDILEIQTLCKSQTQKLKH